MKDQAEIGKCIKIKTSFFRAKDGIGKIVDFNNDFVHVALKRAGFEKIEKVFWHDVIKIL